MSNTAPLPAAMSFAERAFYKIPVLGWIARDLVYGSEDTIWYALVIVLTALVLAVKTWGIAALVMAALGFVPIMFLFLIVVASPWTKSDASDH